MNLKFQLLLGALSASFGGIAYEADENGIIEAPAEAAEAFGSHGILPVVGAEPTPAAPVKLTIAQIKDGIQDADLEALEVSETAGDNRVGVFEVIAAEKVRREALLSGT
jgi:hypothetical protein